MTIEQKQHYFMFTANYKDLNLGDGIQVYYGNFGYSFKNITKKMIKEIEEQTLEQFKLSNPNDVVHEYRIVSLGYLGEMTPTEFNS